MFPVVPGQDVRVTLNSVASGKDYDLALYGDIEAAYEQLSGDDLTSAGASATAGVGDDQTLQYPEEVAEIPTKANPPEGRQFAPRIYAPRIYAPRIYAPRIYAPRIYAPRIYAPRIYAPDSYIPELVSDDVVPGGVLGGSEPDLASRRQPARHLRGGQRVLRQHQRQLLRPGPGPRRPGLRRGPRLHADGHRVRLRLRHPRPQDRRDSDAADRRRCPERPGHRHRHRQAEDQLRP